MATKKSSGRKSGRKYGKAAGKSVASAVRRAKRGTLRSGIGGKGGTVKNRKQAIAIGLSEAREKGAKVPPRKKASESGISWGFTRQAPLSKNALLHARPNASI